MEGDCLNKEELSCSARIWTHMWQAGYLFCTNSLQSLGILKSKESCILKGLVKRNTFKLGLMTSTLLFGFVITFGQKYVAL